MARFKVASASSSGSDLALADGLTTQQDTLATVTSTAENGTGSYTWTLTDPSGASQTSRLSGTSVASVTFTPYNGLDDDKWLAGNWVAACTDGTVTVKHVIQIGTDSGHILHDWTTRVEANTQDVSGTGSGGAGDGVGARDAGNEDWSDPYNPTLAINGTNKCNMYQSGAEGFCVGFTSPICSATSFDDMFFSAYSIILVTDADEIAAADSSQNGVYAGLCENTTFGANEGIACGVDRTSTGVIKAVSCKVGSSRNVSGNVASDDPQRFEGVVLRWEPEGSSVWAIQIVNAQSAAGVTTDSAVQTSMNEDFSSSPQLFCGIGSVAGGMASGWTQALKVYYKFFPQYDGPSS